MKKNALYKIGIICVGIALLAGCKEQEQVTHEQSGTVREAEGASLDGITENRDTDIPYSPALD